MSVVAARPPARPPARPAHTSRQPNSLLRRGWPLLARWALTTASRISLHERGRKTKGRKEDLCGGWRASKQEESI